MWAQSVRERPFAVLAAAVAVNMGALFGLFTSAPVFEASASVVITADAVAPTGVASAPDLDRIAARVVSDLRGSDALTPASGPAVTLVDRSVDASHLLVATATADSRSTAEGAVESVGTLARTQIESGAAGVTTQLVRTPAVTSGHTVSAARILAFAGGAGLLALALIALFAPAVRRPVETAITAAPPRVPQARRAPAASVLRLAPTIELDDEDDEVLTPVRQPTAHPTRQTGRERAAAIKMLVQQDWARSGSNVAWTKKQTKAAFARAEQKLAASERAASQGRPANDDRDADWQSWGLGG